MTDQVEIPPLIVAARRYKGVKFRHRGRSEMALDCVGLGVRAYADCGVVVPDVRYYGREPHDGGLMRALIAALGEPVGNGPDAELQVGDVACFQYNDEPHHVGLIGWLDYGALSIIHADSVLGKVVENRLDDVWRQRINAVFRRPV